MLVETRALTKRYAATTALEDVALAVPAGTVYGLIGPNGSGKTTLLSVLAGLRRPTSGSIHLDVDPQRVAVLPDTPQFDPWLTAREVVDLARTLVDASLSADRVEPALADAGLGDAADRRTGGFSRGMLQRLGLAATLVADPALVLLDEPASALDPAGRREVLDLVAAMRGTRTVLFSSHILGDVQQVCDTVGILRAGRLLYQGSIDDLLVGRAGPAYRIRLRSEPASAREVLERSPWVTAVEPQGPVDLVVHVTAMADAERGLIPALAEAGARVVFVEPDAPDLEQVVLELTS